MLKSQLFARKTVDQCIADGSVGGGLRRSLGPVQLTALGIGAIIGAGIFAAIRTAISGDSGHVGAGSGIVIPPPSAEPSLTNSAGASPAGPVIVKPIDVIAGP